MGAVVYEYYKNTFDKICGKERFEAGSIRSRVAKHCEKALALKGNLYQAANCLCLCHFIAQNMEECKRYYKIAVTNGGNPDTLKEEIKKLREGMMLASDDDLWWDL